mmetsp:Transcript_38124/g.61058  ORF Transcript_38124/g.61058 Transcript_38124/m.61058 type:complete len:119 (-) Transcript_38124:80-436(-)
MLLASDYPAALGPYARTMPILLTHGTADATVPYEYGQGSAGLLKQMGLQVDFQTYDGVGHIPTLPVLTNMTAFVVKQLVPTTAPQVTSWHLDVLKEMQHSDTSDDISAWIAQFPGSML